MPDPLVQKRKENEDNMKSGKKLKVEEGTIEERLKNSTIPYWNIPYTEQVIKKK